MKENRTIRRGIIVCLIFFLLFGAFAIWKKVRSNTVLPDLTCVSVLNPYPENDRLLLAACVSYFTYGCEKASTRSATVSELIDSERMGILTENFGVKRTIRKDPSTAVFDTAELIRSAIGSYRFLCDLKDESGFYGMALCDDDMKCVWVSFSGSVSFQDGLSCVGLVALPGLTRQENFAFRFYREILDFEEVKDEKYTVLLTGHSLGGALATEIAFVSGCPAVTINGADGIAIDKIKGISGREERADWIVNYSTSPKNGRLSIMDCIQRLTYLGSYRDVFFIELEENGLTDDTHCAFSSISF